MERLKLIVAVAGHGLGERMGAALEGAGCAVCFHLSGQGTAKAAWLEMLGLSDTRRDVLLAPCPEGRVARGAGGAAARRRTRRATFAVAIPLSGIAGRDAYEQLTQGGNAHGQSSLNSSSPS